jgi:uncharacterized protein DUF5681
MAKWAKGVSGNPGGRPKGEGDIRTLAQLHTASAINRLVKVMNDDTAAPSAQVAAATALLDRAWGRPAQTIRASIESDHNRMESVMDQDFFDRVLARIKNRTPSEITHEAEAITLPALSSLSS